MLAIVLMLPPLILVSHLTSCTYYHADEYNALTVDAGNKKKAGASSTPMNAKEVGKKICDEIVIED